MARYLVTTLKCSEVKECKSLKEANKLQRSWLKVRKKVFIYKNIKI